MEARKSADNDNSTAKTFVPGEGESAEEAFVTNFTPEQKETIRQMVANAKSPAEIDEIERSVKRGIFPSLATETPAPDAGPPPPPPEEEASPPPPVEEEAPPPPPPAADSGDDQDRKRKAKEPAENGTPAKKKKTRSKRKK